MIIVVSDLHLEARRAMHSVLQDRLLVTLRTLITRARDRGVKEEITLLLLGDIFECLNTIHWLDDLRPWDRSKPAEVSRVLDSLLEDAVEINAGLTAGMNTLIQEFGLRTIYVYGNHDAILNTPVGKRGRDRLRNAIQKLEFYEGSVWLDKQHSVMARHGHEWDPDNRSPDHRAPFGDAIVVEFILGLRKSVADVLKWNRDDPRLSFLTEIDLVRPHTPRAVAQWIDGQIKGRDSEKLRQAVGEAYRITATTFETLIRSNSIHRGSFTKWKRWLLNVSPLRMSKIVPESLDEEPDYHAMARQEFNRSGDYRFVVCGHTHLAECVPISAKTDRPRAPIYLNTGAWRQVYYRVHSSARSHYPFRWWDESCLIAFYSESEQRDCSYPAYEFSRWRLGF